MIYFCKRIMVIIVLAVSLANCAPKEYTPSPIHTKITNNHFERMEQLLQTDNDSSYYLHYQFTTPEAPSYISHPPARAKRVPIPQDNDSSYYYNQQPKRNQRPHNQYVPSVDNDASYVRPQRNINRSTQPVYPQDNDSYYRPHKQSAPVYPQDNDSAYTPTRPNSSNQEEYPADNDTSYKLYFD